MAARSSQIHVAPSSQSPVGGAQLGLPVDGCVGSRDTCQFRTRGLLSLHAGFSALCILSSAENGRTCVPADFQTWITGFTSWFRGLIKTTFTNLLEYFAVHKPCVGTGLATCALCYFAFLLNVLIYRLYTGMLQMLCKYCTSWKYRVVVTSIQYFRTQY